MNAQTPGPDLSKKDLTKLPLDLMRSLSECALGRKPVGIVAELQPVMSKKSAFTNGGIILPLDALTRSLTAGVLTQGGAAVGSALGPIEQKLRAASFLGRAGAQFVLNQTSNLSIPLEIGETTMAWYEEGEEIAESDPNLGAFMATPKRVGGATSIRRQLEVQQPLVNEFLLTSLFRGITSAIERAAIQGTGWLAEPLGLLEQPGVAEVTFAGAATWADALAFEKNITGANGDDGFITYVAHPDVRERWRQIQRFTGVADTLWHSDRNEIAGHSAVVTTNCPSDKIVAGDWSKYIVTMFGEGTPINLVVDPFTHATDERIRFVCQAYADVGAFRPAVFCRAADSAVA